MKYLLMIYNDETQFDMLGQAEMGQRLTAYRAYTEALQKAGVLVASERLRPVTTATTVRTVGGKAQVLDGPYAEAKEQLGGFYLVDVPDLDAALMWAKRCPGAGHGVMEVRPIWDMTTYMARAANG